SFKMILENIDMRKSADPVVKVIIFLLSELKEGNVSIGGKTTSGLGNVTLENISAKIITIDDIKKGEYGYKKIELFNK
ncbi:MAG: hypothetical protein ACTSR2_13495, partial [Candidatus Hodarchaeales archaeon]